ncbi:MAG: sigma-70 family RNA polymerase sigma factor [Firmicutes bacterium]|nr:sigma-70 family RNA polymerase sigma factor [Bacillota bacterium]
MTIRSAKKYGGDIYLSDPVSKDKEGNEISIMDIIGSDTDMVIDAVDTGMNIKRMYEIFDRVLKEREKQVLKLRYGLMGGREMPQREVAKVLGISRSYVSRIEKKAIGKLREEMKKE